MEQQAARQPDFGRLASNFKDISEQVQRFENIPAFEGGTQLMRKMDQIFEAVTDMRHEMRHEISVLRTEMTDMRREMRHELDGFRTEMTDMRRELDGFGLKMMITDKNFKARMANSIVVSGEMTLSPLYNVTTGEEVSHCPETLADLEQCDVDIAAAILRELGERVPRAHEQRRRQLKLTFGIRTRVI